MKKKIFLGLGISVVVLIIAVVVGVAYFLDDAIKKGVETFGPQITKVDVKLDSVKISILSGSGDIKGLVLGNPEGYQTPSSISVGTASLALSPGSVFSDKVVVKHIRVEAPEITFEGGLGGNNLSTILDNVKAATAGDKPETTEPETSGPGKKLQVDDFLIAGAKVTFHVKELEGKPIVVEIPDIHLTDLGQGPEGITSAELTKVALTEIVEAATKAAASGKLKELTKGATDALNDATKSATESLQKSTKGVTDLFKKRE